MEHFIRRCKHCQKEYTYCTYGNGPEYGTEEGCSMDYCAECQKAIDAAFAKIPVKFIAKEMEIKEPLLFPLFDKVKADYDKKVKEDYFAANIVAYGFEGSKYDFIETYVHNGKMYKVKWYEKSPEKKHIFIMMEFDVLNGKFTNKPWHYERQDSYMKTGNVMKRMMKGMKKITAKPMKMPEGKLFFLDTLGDDITWDLVTPKTVEPPKKEHILRTHTSCKISGACIKQTAKHGWHKTKVVVDEGINVKKLLNFIDYQYTWVQYDDEDTATIIKIECV